MMANNIIKRIWNQNKMVQIEDLKGMAFQAEDGGHTFEIYGIDEAGETVSLTGTPSGVFLRPDNTDVVLDCSVSDGVVSATLPDECYDVPGRGGLTVFITADGKKTALYAAVVTVSRTSSGNVAPPATQTVVDLINAISAAVATIPASYSALMADIAPTYSDSALYAVGQYAWYDGDLKRCIVPITTAESYTAAHWTSAVLGNDVSDLKSALGNSIIMMSGSFQSDKWSSSYYSAILPVIPNSKYTLKGSSSSTSPYMGLTSFTYPPTVGDDQNMSAATGWTTQRTLAKNGIETGVIPADVHWLYFYAGLNTSYTRMPVSIVINGVDAYANCFEEVRETAKILADTNDILTGTNDNVAYNFDTDKTELNNVRKFVVVNGRIDNNVWTDANSSTTLSALIPVSSGDVVEIVGTGVTDSNSPIACLKSIPNYPPQNGDTIVVSESASFNSMSIPKDGVFVNVVPSDGNYLFCYYGLGNHSYSRKPQSIKINGYEYIDSLKDNLVSCLNDYAGKTIPFNVPCYNNENVWTYNATNGYHSIIVPVTGAERIKVVASSQNTTPSFFAKAFPVIGESVSYSDADGWDTVINIGKAEVFDEIIPSDVRFAIFYCGSASETRKPQAIYLDNVCIYAVNENLFDIVKNDMDTVTIPTILSISHGGYSRSHNTDGAPFDSLPAVKLAKEKGFLWVELDVHFTSDNVPVLCHDDDIYRYATYSDGTNIPEGTVKISETTYQGLLQYNFNKGAVADYPDLKITTFERIMQFCKNVGMSVSLEMKRDVTPTNSQIEILFQIARKYGMEKNMEWRSAASEPLEYISKYHPCANLAINPLPNTTTSGAQVAVALGRTLLTGKNHVAITIDTTAPEAAFKVISDNGMIPESGWDGTTESLATLNTYAFRYFSNSIPVEAALYEYEMAQS